MVVYVGYKQQYNRVYQKIMEGMDKKTPEPGDVKYIQDALYVVGGKWKLPILHSLATGMHKFRDIQRSIPNITSRMLAKELKELELNGFITRMACDNVVDYEVTDYCQSFEKIIVEMIDWGKRHRARIKRADTPKQSLNSSFR